MRVKRWYYINLKHRTDRDVHVRSELIKCGIPEANIQRVNAISNSIGALGCAQSHVKTLMLGLASGYDYFGVVEDDFTVHHPTTFLNTIEAAPPFDVFLNSLGTVFGYTAVPYKDSYVRVQKSITTSSYIISQKYASVLLKNFKEAVKNIDNNPPQMFRHHAIDVHWGLLQKNPNALWLSTLPALGYQRDDYSDIEKKRVTYRC
jgi:GR25 family glycosyltransferase involved in LPS biosynthesis